MANGVVKLEANFTGCTGNWDALKKWDDEYLLDKIGDSTVTVAITPNGLADAIHKGQFTLPFETLVALHTLT